MSSLLQLFSLLLNTKQPSICVLGVRVLFEQEELDTANNDSDLMIFIIESIAQAENESRSDNIRWGIKPKASDGSSKLYNRKYYGYANAKDGSLIMMTTSLR